MALFLTLSYSKNPNSFLCSRYPFLLLSSLDVLLKDFSSYAAQVISQIVSHVENMAASQKHPLVYLTSSKLPKEQRTLELLKGIPVSDGLVCIFRL